jgi:NAD dependent epimerase/dehydratase family enzyme
LSTSPASQWLTVAGLTKEKKRIRDSRVNGTSALVSVLQPNLKSADRALKVFVHGSAIGIYGNREDEILDHQSAPGTGFLASVVSEWEAAISELEAAENLRTVTVRTGVVLSRQGGALKKMLPIFRNGLGARLGFAGAQWMSWIHHRRHGSICSLHADRFLESFGSD